MTDNNCFEIGPLLEYNSLLDPYLKNYFTKPRMRHHLVKAGLINKSGFIISEENCKKVNSKKQKHKFVQDSLAQLIVNETVLFDLKRQKEIKDKLIEISNIENVIKIRNERKLEKRDYLFEFLESIHIKNKKKKKDTLLHSSLKSLKSIRNNLDDRHFTMLNSTKLFDIIMPHNYLSENKKSIDKSPYNKNLISEPELNYLKLYKHKKVKKKKDTENVGELILHRSEPALKNQEKIQTFCRVTMRYHRKPHNETNNLAVESYKHDYIKVLQQHCGGNSIIIFSKKVKPNSNFTFYSRRHRGFPFSVTVYVNDIAYTRINVCCEYKHTICKKLGENNYFSIVAIKGAQPCFKCITENYDVKKNKKKKKKKVKTSPIIPLKYQKESSKENNTISDDYNNESFDKLSTDLSETIHSSTISMISVRIPKEEEKGYSENIKVTEMTSLNNKGTLKIERNDNDTLTNPIIDKPTKPISSQGSEKNKKERCQSAKPKKVGKMKKPPVNQMNKPVKVPNKIKVFKNKEKKIVIEAIKSHDESEKNSIVDYDTQNSPNNKHHTSFILDRDEISEKSSHSKESKDNNNEYVESINSIFDKKNTFNEIYSMPDDTTSDEESFSSLKDFDILSDKSISGGKDAENVKNNANLINNSNITKPENFNRKLTDSLLKNKNKLILNSINITEDNFLDILQFIENSEIMTSISINNCNISSDQTDQILQKIISNQRFHQTVQHLNLNQNQLSQKCIENIRNLLKCCEKCTNISLSNCGLHNGDLEILSDVMQRKQIDTLYLNSNKFEANFIKNILHIFDTDNENESNKKKIINALSVNGNDIVKSDIETLAHKLKSGTLRIRNLSLDYCKLDDEMIEILFDALISNIYTKSIDLEGNNITDASQKSFENLLRNNKSINSLTVYPGNDIKPEFVTRIHNEMLLRRIPKHDENIDDEI